MKRISAVIFDLDGIIVDSEPLQLESFNQILSQYRVSLTPLEFKQYVGTTQPFIFGELKKRYTIGESIEALIERKKAVYLRLVKEKMQPKEGLVELASWLQRKGVRTGIASSSPPADILAILDLLGLGGLFERVVSAFGLPHSKPFPDVYLKAAAELGVPPETCLALEDSGYGVEAAKRAGMVCIAVPNFFTEDQDFLQADHRVGSLQAAQKLIERYL